jgi:hypothetical protein
VGNQEDREKTIIKESEKILRQKEDGFLLRSVEALSEKINIPGIDKIEVLKTLTKHPETFLLTFDSQNYDEQKGPLFGLREDLKKIEQEAQENQQDDLFSPQPSQGSDLQNLVDGMLGQIIGSNKNEPEKKDNTFSLKTLDSFLRKIHAQIGNVLQIHGVELFAENKEMFDTLNEIQTKLTSSIVKIGNKKPKKDDVSGEE